MDSVDRYIEKGERDASPNRFPDATSHTQHDKVERHEPIERTATMSSSGSSSSASSAVDQGAGNMSRVPTQHDTEAGLSAERHATALSRIQTQRSQHSGTVGAGLRSRTSKKPLPAFGAHKPYPPPLPEREGILRLILVFRSFLMLYRVCC